jgi:hypothetical protein
MMVKGKITGYNPKRVEMFFGDSYYKGFVFTLVSGTDEYKLAVEDSDVNIHNLVTAGIWRFFVECNIYKSGKYYKVSTVEIHDEFIALARERVVDMKEVWESDCEFFIWSMEQDKYQKWKKYLKERIERPIVHDVER